MTTPEKSIWDGPYKIPWNDSEFSRRMLREHLSQEHDLASRKSQWIEKQVGWIHDALLKKEPARILDLACGPGLYSTRLAALGHNCLGVDFGPASIEYAREKNPNPSKCRFVLDDIRTAAFHGPFDLAMILYGELNVFSPLEIATILRKTKESLSSPGRLIVEVQTPQSIETMGRADPSEYRSDCGLFSDAPHTCRTTNQWLPSHKVAIQTFEVIKEAGEKHSFYRSTTKAWSDEELQSLLRSAGFSRAFPDNNWPGDSEALSLWVAEC